MLKINKKERILLSLLLFIILGFGYYNLVYIKQKESIEELDIKKVELEDKYNETIETIKHIKEKESKIGTLTKEMNLKAREFYPKIIQEKIVLELDEYIKGSKMEGNISFGDVVVDIVEASQSPEENNKETTFEPFVKEYNGESKKSEVIDGNELEKVENQNIENTTVENIPTVQHIKATITYKGIYECVKSFISKIESNGRNVAITDLTTSSGLNGELTGNINLEFYAIPKINNLDASYLNWSLEDTYGTDMPFVVEKPVEITPESLSNIQNTSKNGDFFIILKSSVSDLPSVLISKSGDSTNETLISQKNKSIENIEFEFNKVNDKYYYKYKTSTTSYPKEYSSSGIEFIPSNDKISIDVQSESRVGVDDKSGVKITVKNNTDKLVDFVVSNDDEVNPRVSIIGENGKVTMSKN